MATEGGFLGRWSRQKSQAQTREQPLAAPAPSGAGQPDPVAAPLPVAPPPEAQPATGEGAAAAGQWPAPTLADVAGLTPASDFSRFVARGVSAQVRNAALKKLFADPHFNVMDGLDIYIDDYSIPSPLEPELIGQMNASRFLDQARLLDPQPLPEPEPRTEADATLPNPELAGPAPQAPVPETPPTPHDHPDLQLQPDPAAGPGGAGPGAE